MKRWLKGQAAFNLGVILGILLISVIPTSQHTESVSAPVSISSYRQAYALLPTSATTNDNLCRDRRNDNDSYRRTAAIAEATVHFWGYNYLTSNPGTVSLYIGIPDSTFNEEFHQACLLLDTPPPSA